MLISKAPYRVSFFGGGTDHPEYFSRKKSVILSTTIDKYCYIFLNDLRPFFDHKYQINWSKIERINDVQEITHPSVRNSLIYKSFKDGLSVSHVGDLPGFSGMGSSSSFCVALLNGLNLLKDQNISKTELALEAFFVERDMNGEKVGLQDQAAAALGGFNILSFSTQAEKIHIEREVVELSASVEEEFRSWVILAYVPIARYASDMEEKKFKDLDKAFVTLDEINDHSQSSIETFKKGFDIEKMGEALFVAWELKKKMHSAVSTDYIDEMFSHAKSLGAIGGKLLGAGGGGFCLFIVPPPKQDSFKDGLKLFCINLGFDKGGAKAWRVD